MGAERKPLGYWRCETEREREHARMRVAAVGLERRRWT